MSMILFKWLLCRNINEIVCEGDKIELSYSLFERSWWMGDLSFGRDILEKEISDKLAGLRALVNSKHVSFSYRTLS